MIMLKPWTGPVQCTAARREREERDRKELNIRNYSFSTDVPRLKPVIHQQCENGGHRLDEARICHT